MGYISRLTDGKVLLSAKNASQPSISSFLWEAIVEIGTCVRAMVANEEGQLPAGEDVAGLNATMAPAHSVTAEHDEIGFYVIPGVTVDVVEGEGPYVLAQRTLAPAQVKHAQKIRITNSSAGEVQAASSLRRSLAGHRASCRACTDT